MNKLGFISAFCLGPRIGKTPMLSKEEEKRLEEELAKEREAYIAVLLREAKFPKSVYVNKEKRTVVLVFEVKDERNEIDEKFSFVAKASDDDKFNPELGFLVAYYHKVLGVAKHKTPETARQILGSKPTFLKGYLYNEFMKETGFDLEKATKYIKRKTK